MIQFKGWDMLTLSAQYPSGVKPGVLVYLGEKNGFYYWRKVK